MIEKSIKQLTGQSAKQLRADVMASDQRENNLPLNKQMLVEQKFSNDRKSLAMTWLLWIFCGLTGAYRQYANQNYGLDMLAWLIISCILMPFDYIGMIPLLCLAVLWFRDGFYLKRWTISDNVYIKHTEMDMLPKNDSSN